MATTAPSPAGPASFLPAGALSDDALARRVHAGDDRAFEEIYSRYHLPLFRYCASMLGDPQEAEEALQSAMFSAYRALRDHDRELNLRPWLYRIAHNQSLDIIRRRREADELSGLEEEPGLNLAEQVDLREDVRQLRRDLAALVPEQRTALVLREMGGLSHAEIAQTLEATPAAAKQLIHDARRSLTAFESGRSLACADVQRRLSDQDGRVLRGGAIKSHLRACPDCGLFRETMKGRGAQMRALVPPLSPVAAQGILASVLEGTGTAMAAGGAALAGGTAGGLGTGLAVKIALVGAVAVAGVAAVGVPLGLTERIAGSDSSSPARAEQQPATGAAGAAAAASAPASTPPSRVPRPRAANPAAGGPAAAASPAAGGATSPGAGLGVGADPASGQANASAAVGGASASVRADASAGSAGASVSAGPATASAGVDAPSGSGSASVGTPAGSATVTAGGGSAGVSVEAPVTVPPIPPVLPPILPALP